MINTISILLDPKQYKVAKDLSRADLKMKLTSSKKYFPHVKFYSHDVLSISFCPAKLLFGNNLYEVRKCDLQAIVCALVERLKHLGIEVSTRIILLAHCWRIDYSKIVYVPLTAEMVFNQLQQCLPSGQLKKAITLYPEKGCMVAVSLKKRKFCFYNKSAEILSDSKNTSCLTQNVKQLRGVFWRVELSLKKTKEIKREFSANNLLFTNTLQNIFDEQIAQRLLTKRFNMFMSNLCTGYSGNEMLELVQDWLSQKKLPGRSAILSNIAGVIAVKNLGIETVCKIIASVKNKRVAQKFKHDMKELFSHIHRKPITRFKIAFQAGLKVMKPMDAKRLQTLLSRHKKIPNRGIECLDAPVLHTLFSKHLSQLLAGPEILWITA